MIPEGHDVITAILSAPLSIAEPMVDVRSFLPPNTILSPFMNVHSVDGSTKFSMGLTFRNVERLLHAGTNWNVNCAQLAGEWSTVVNPFTDAHTECAPENAQPWSISFLETLRETYFLVRTLRSVSRDGGGAVVLLETERPNTTFSNSDSSRYLA